MKYFSMENKLNTLCEISYYSNSNQPNSKIRLLQRKCVILKSFLSWCFLSRISWHPHSAHIKWHGTCILYIYTKITETGRFLFLHFCQPYPMLHSSDFFPAKTTMYKVKSYKMFKLHIAECKRKWNCSMTFQSEMPNMFSLCLKLSESIYYSGILKNEIAV